MLTGGASITIENMLGQVVYTSEIKNQKSEINTSSFVAGFYLVKVKTASGSSVQKVLVEM